MSTTVVREQAVEPSYVISRWTIPFAGFLLSLMGGISYAWGVFIVPLETTFGWSRSEASLPVSIYLLVFCTVGMIYGGTLQDRYGPRKVAAAGGIFFLVAYLMASQINSFPHLWWLLISYGVLGGLGCGLAYCAIVPTMRKWFPDRVSLAITLGITGFGIASTIFAPWITRLIATHGIANTFLVLGLVTSVVTLFAAWLIRIPQPGWTPPGWEVSKATTGKMFAPKMEATLGEAIKTPLLWLIWLGFIFIIFGGLMAMTHVTPYGISILGLERPEAALAMVFFGLANGFGRPIGGLIAEKVGPLQVMLVTYLITAATYFMFNNVATTTTCGRWENRRRPYHAGPSGLWHQ